MPLPTEGRPLPRSDRLSCSSVGGPSATKKREGEPRVGEARLGGGGVLACEAGTRAEEE